MYNIKDHKTKKKQLPNASWYSMVPKNMSVRDVYILGEVIYFIGWVNQNKSHPHVHMMPQHHVLVTDHKQGRLLDEADDKLYLDLISYI